MHSNTRAFVAPLFIAALLSAALFTAAPAQTPPGAPPPPTRQPPGAQAPALSVGPRIERIETASAVSPDAFGAITNVRELSNGSILVNDGGRRRLLVLDTTLAVTRVALDSLSDIAQNYGTRAGSLIPWRGDTTFFVDPAALAVVVLGPDATMQRVRAVWRAQDVNWFANATGNFGFPAMDGRGRVVYRIPATPAPPAVRPPANVPYFPPQPDSAFIVAVDLETRRVDTLGIVRIPKVDNRIRQSAEGQFSIETTVNPLPVQDQWAVLPDGTVAFVRSQGYRIEFIDPDGSRRITPRIPYDWQRLTDADKDALVDSVRTALHRTADIDFASNMIRWSNMYGRPYPPGFSVPDGYVPPFGFARDWILPPGVQFPQNYVYACGPGEEPPPGMNAMMGMMGGAIPAGASVTISGGPPSGAPAVMPPPGGVVQREGAVVREGAVREGPVVREGAAPQVQVQGAPPAGMCLPAPPVTTGGTAPPPPQRRFVGVIPAYELPDYRPALMPGAQGAVRADSDGNLWIRIALPRPVPGGAVYDIVNRQGELTRRIQLPPGHSLVGFGRDGVVYLSMRDPTGLKLARVRLRQDG